MVDLSDDLAVWNGTCIRLQAGLPRVHPRRRSSFPRNEPHRFLDVGTPERLAEAHAAVAAGLFS